MADIDHKLLTTTDLHVPGRTQSSDPGAVGPEQLWVDTSRLAATGYIFVRFRNSTDSQWTPVACNALISESGVYTATAQQVRSHIDDATLHRVINDAATTAVALWSAQKITASLSPLSAHVADATLHRVINDSVTSAITLWSSTKISASLALKQDTATAGQLVPPGTIITFGGEGAPSGYIQCSGGQVSRTTYAALFSAIGTSWGFGNGSTTFHVPDLVGRFLRMRDYGWGRDPDSASRTAANSGGSSGDAVGSVQSHQYQSHAHTYSQMYKWGNNGGTGQADVHWNPRNTTANSGSSGGNETRPINAYVNFYIKY